MVKPLKVHCNTCNGNTTHKVLKNEERNWEVEEHALWGRDTYEIVECLGCQEISFLHTSIFSEDYDPETGNIVETKKVYPDRTIGLLEEKSFDHVPSLVKGIYSETIKAYNGGLNLLCASGLRAIIEGICIDQGITYGHVNETSADGISRQITSESLEGKINSLKAKGLITKKQMNILHEHRYLGNDAIHSLKKPSKKLLGIAIDVLEHTLDLLYEMDEKEEELTYRRQLRNKAKKTSP